MSPVQPRIRRGAKTPRGRETRAAILAAARTMFAGQWLDQLSLAELARAAGTTRASVLFQFPEGWPDIAAQLLIEELETAAAVTAELAKSRQKPEQRLRSALHYMLGRGEELGALLPNLRAFNLIWGDAIDATVTPYLEASLARIMQLLCDTAPGRQSLADARNAAEALYSFALDLACAPPYRRMSAAERTEKLDTAITIMLKGLTRK